MKKIAFDLWGTLAYLKPGKDFGIAIARELGIEKDEYHELVKRFWFKRDLSAGEFAEILVNETGKTDASIKYLTEQISSPYGRHSIYPDTKPTLERLSETSELILVSDTSSLGKRMFYDLEISQFFKKLYFSCELGLTKEEGLYSKAFEFMNIKPEEVLVVGDSLRSDNKIPLELGSRVVLIDRTNKYPNEQSIKSLEELK